jgi:hypothetical protein
VARNSALVLRFDDVLDDDATAQLELGETVRVLTGYPPVVPYLTRIIFDPNYGAVIGGQFHSSRLLVDMTVTESELDDIPFSTPVNAVGLPASLENSVGPNVAVRIPTKTSFGTGQFRLLRGHSGVPLATTDNGPVDSGSPTRDVVRAMRSGNPIDENNGFLLDLNAPEIVGSWALQVDSATFDPQGQAGFDLLVNLSFPTICRGAPNVGDVVALTGANLEVTQNATPPDQDGKVLDVRVRSLAEEPLTSTGALLGNAQLLSTFDPAETVPAACWVSFFPLPGTPPSTALRSDVQVVARFSEPMDPASLSPFDTLLMARGDSNSIISANNLVVAEVRSSTDLKVFTLVPLLPLAHDAGLEDPYHVRLNGVTDLAGNPLANQLPAINFTLDGTQPRVLNGGTVMRFNGLDEVEPLGVDDLRGQFFIDPTRGFIRPRPVAFTGYPADRINPVVSIQVPFALGVQTPLAPLGSRLHTVWRYCDFGWQVLDESKYNLDVFGIDWAPLGGVVTSDFYEKFEMRLSHSRFLPDESIDNNLLPNHDGSGLRGRGSFFGDNILVDPLSPQKVVHEASLGYQIRSSDLFVSASSRKMLPYPMNRLTEQHTTYTWRDTAVLAVGGPQGVGIPLDIESGQPLFLENDHGYVARSGQVPSLGLPLLMEIRCYPSDTGIGLNSFDVNLAVNSSALPAFRSYSSGGINTTGTPVFRNPDTELAPDGGFNPRSNPPGRRTARANDNTFYIGQLDVVTRISRVHTVWLNTFLPSPDYVDPHVLPAAVDQPLGTEVVIEYRGATGFELQDLDPELDEGQFPFDSDRLNAYGEIYFILNGSHEVLGSAQFMGQVDFFDGVRTWRPDIDEIDGAQFVQMRITFLSNIETGLSPVLSAIGIAYSQS